MSRLELAIGQIMFARTYTLRLLDAIPADDWFRAPPGGVTHVAWQAGHLAVAEYWLALVRIRGRRPEDEALIPQAFQDPFERFTTPVFDPAVYASPATIRATLDRVHEQTLRELPTLDEAELDRPAMKPHDFVRTKLEALLWCAQHEGVHAGQIGLLRRQLGHDPLW